MMYTRAVWRSVALVAVIGAGCGKVAGGANADATGPADAGDGDDAAIDAMIVDGPPSDALLGSKDNPARSCVELRTAAMPSGVYWLAAPAGQSVASFEVYCEQVLNGGGWALMENSVRRADGKTTAFWQFKFADRLKQMGAPALDQNYYNGAIYLLGSEYMDFFVDLQDKAAVAAVMTATGFDPMKMTFTMPTFVTGNTQVFNGQFAAGWSSSDFDNDLATASCPALDNNVAQHYNNCWAYSLGSDADDPRLDGGVGPHVHNPVLTERGLSLQPGTGVYSQVKRISRFARW
jgi:hypothetical protein